MAVQYIIEYNVNKMHTSQDLKKYEMLYYLYFSIK